MKIKVEIKRKDLMWLYLACLPKLKSTYVNLLIFALIVFAFYSWSGGFPDCEKEWIRAAKVTALGTVIAFLFGTAYSFCSLLFLKKESNGVLGEHEYELSEDGLHEKTSINEGLNRWSVFQDIKLTNHYILFQMPDYLFHIIPKRYFSSESDVKEFYDTALNLYQNSNNI